MKNDKLKKLQSEEVIILDEIDRVCKKENINYFLAAGTLLGAIRHKGFIPWDDDIDVGIFQADFDRFITAMRNNAKNIFEVDCYETNNKCVCPFIKIRLKNTKYIEKKFSKMFSYDDIEDSYNGIWVDVFCYNNIESCNLKKVEKIFKKRERLYTLINIKLKTDYYNSNWIKEIIYKFVLNFVPLRYLTNKLRKITNECDNDNSEYICNYCGNLSLEKEILPRDKILPLKTVEFNNKKYLAPKDCDYYLSHLYGDYMKLPPKNKRVNHDPYYIKFTDGEELWFKQK